MVTPNIRAISTSRHLGAGARLFIRAPNHLGDAIMAMPSILALVESASQAWIAVPAWGQWLFASCGASILEPRQVPSTATVAVIMAPSFRAAWLARRIPRRIGLATDARWPLLSDAIQPAGLHRSQDYRNLAAVLGVRVSSLPSIVIPARARKEWEEFPQHVALNPVSRSGSTVQWPGFASLRERLEQRVTVYAGPGEAGRATQATGLAISDGRSGETNNSNHLLAGLPLERVVGALSRCQIMVSNDSGMAHFAAACGVPTIVIHTSTTASRTGAPGALALEGPDMPCRPCYRKTCTEGLACLRVPVEHVLEAVRTLLGS